MSNPYLLFCPYLPLDEPVTFDYWELGPLQSFKDRWADPRFKDQATAFLNKFVDTYDQSIDNPALLCRKGKQLDGQQPSKEEQRALELALTFAFVDGNPRRLPNDQGEGWGAVTTDNAELYVWPIDLEQGRVTVNTGYMVPVSTGGYRISCRNLVLRPPQDLYLSQMNRSPDPLVLTGIYKTVLGSLRCPGKNTTADRVRVALEWFAKAWRNTATLHHPERLVFLKTAFEALTGTSLTHESARNLRLIFEKLSNTTAENSEIAEALVWSPTEKPLRRTRVSRTGRSQTHCKTDLETWFTRLGEVRNTIIHEGKQPPLTYCGPNRAYNGHLVFTAEFVLRGAIKVLLSTELDYKDAWRSESCRAIDAIIDGEE